MSDKRFRGDQWFNKKTEGRTKEALRKRNAEFAREHSGTSDEELLEYVREQAERLGFTPNAGEIIGGEYISSRFGGWNSVVALAGLRAPKGQPPITKRQIYKEEFKRQARLFKKEREAQKEALRAERRARNDAAIAELQVRAVRDMAWGEEHREDTDGEILEYVRQCAAENGRTPFEKEVLGGVYIRERFGSWPVVIHLAGLPPRHGMKPVKATTLNAYLKKKKPGKPRQRKNQHQKADSGHLPVSICQ